MTNKKRIERKYIKQDIKIAMYVVIVATELSFGSTIELHAEQISVKISTSKIAEKDKKTTIKWYRSEAIKANKRIARKTPKGQKPNFIRSLDVVDACTATVNCAGGTPLSCSLPGPGSCSSTTTSVVCIDSSGSVESSCAPPNDS